MLQRLSSSNRASSPSNASERAAEARKRQTSNTSSSPSLSFPQEKVERMFTVLGEAADVTGQHDSDDIRALLEQKESLV